MAIRSCNKRDQDALKQPITAVAVKICVSTPPPGLAPEKLEKLEKMAHVCGRLEDSLSQHAGDYPLDSVGEDTAPAMKAVLSALAETDKAVNEGSSEMAKYHLDVAYAHLRGLSSFAINRYQTGIDTFETPAEILFYGGLAGAAISIGVIALEFAGPIILTAGSRILLTSAPIFEFLHHYNLLKTPNLKGFIDTATQIYGLVSTANVLRHAWDEPGSDPAKMPMEDLVGKDNRDALGTYQVISILHFLNQGMPKKLAYSPSSLLVLAAGILASEYRVQHNSSGVSRENIDYVRTGGSAASAFLTLAPLNFLWYGAGLWVGWKNIAPIAIKGKEIPNPLSVLGFALSSGAVNSLAFPFISTFLENADLENFWAGLTLREFTLSMPRKFLQSIFGPKTPLSMATYTTIKVAENDVISRHFSLYAGKGLYRKDFKALLASNAAVSEFKSFSLTALASCAGFDLACNERTFNYEDFELIAQDILNGKLTEEEVTKCVGYLSELAKQTKDKYSMRIVKAWLSIFSTVQNEKQIPAISAFMEKHSALLPFEGMIPDVIESINDGQFD